MPKLQQVAEPAYFDMLQWLAEDCCAEFDRVARRRTFARRELIYNHHDRGEHMYRVLSGAVRLSVTRADGREMLYFLFEPGDCFGVSSLLDGEPRPQTAEAGDDLTLQVVDRPSFCRLRATYPSFNDALLRITCRHMRLLSGFLADAYLADITARVANRLAAAVRSFGTPMGGEFELSINLLSQAELGMMVGGSRQTVNKTIQQFQRDGLVSVRGNKLVVHDLAALQAVAGADD